MYIIYNGAGCLIARAADDNSYDSNVLLLLLLLVCVSILLIIIIPCSYDHLHCVPVIFFMDVC